MSNSVKVLYEDNNILAINKPVGLIVHADGRSAEPTLADWILEEHPELKDVGEPVILNGKEIARPGIVHRLDTETSGVLIVVKTKEAFTHFKKQFMDRLVQKEYHAFVWGHFKEEWGAVDVPIGRSIADPRRRLAGRGASGQLREAVTEWWAVRQFEETGERFSFMHLFPKTGRTHQLRVHMKYLQRPIVADHLYAPTMPDALGFARLALHAKKISFIDQDERQHTLEAPYPPDFESAVAKYGAS